MAMDSINIQVITWNVATMFPGEDANLASLLGDTRSRPHIVLLGLQEVKSQPQNLVADTLLAGEDPWTASLRASLGGLGYVKVKSIRLVGIVLSMFCLAEVVASLRGIETQYTRLGFRGYWGSKGCVSIRFELQGVSFCIVNAHLAAHTEFNQARIDSYNSILGEHLYTGSKETEMILYHDYVIFAGDLNFRLEEGAATLEEVEGLVTSGRVTSLLARDQLSLARQQGQAFSELQETLPTFPPTYKYRVGSSSYDTKRLPAWTDRILYKANKANYDSFELSLRQHSYSAHPHFLQSDHKPVTSQFSASVFSQETAASLLLDKFLPIVTFIDSGPHYCNEDLRVVYTVRTEDRRHLSTWDWIGVFRVSESNLEDHLAYTWASTRLVRDAVFEVVLDMTVFPAPGLFRLVYFSTGARDILGWSEPILLRHRQYGVPDEAQEAREGL